LVDPTSDAQSQTYRYKLSAVDSSGNESLVGNYHQPMRLSTDKQSDNIHLTWTPYLVENGSITFDSYKIYKSTDSANLKLAPVVTISSHLPDYNDTASTSLKFKTFYRIAGVLIDTCDPNASKYLKGGSDIYSQSVSNLEDNRLRSSNISAMSDKEFDLRIYPNPCSSFVTISYHLNATSDVKIVIINLMGKEVSSLINTKKQPAGEYYIRLNATEFDKNSGVYLLKLEAGNDITMKKLVVVK
jgi:hypothetical protein